LHAVLLEHMKPDAPLLIHQTKVSRTARIVFRATDTIV
jgi:hypothetical protein